MYLVTIGLEVHVQLKTRSKMFCGCPVEFGAEPNSHTCPTCLGLPGGLPVMNHEAVRMTILTGLMLGMRHRANEQVRPEELFLPGHAEELSDLAIRFAVLHKRQRFVARPRLSKGRAEKYRHAGQGSSSRAHPSRRRRREKFPLRKFHRDRLQPCRHAVDGNCHAAGNQFTGGGLCVSHRAETNPHLWRR